MAYIVISLSLLRRDIVEFQDHNIPMAFTSVLFCYWGWATRQWHATDQWMLYLIGIKLPCGLFISNRLHGMLLTYYKFL